MKKYLRYGNPILAVVVFALCTFASMKDKEFDVGAMFKGSIPTYFFAKGIFCGMTIFLLGKILEKEYEK